MRTQFSSSPSGASDTSLTSGRLALVLLVALVLSASRVEGEELKVGFIYVSPTGDAGWSYSHDLGRKAIDEGMVSLRRSGLTKVRDGLTTLEEVVRETVK